MRRLALPAALVLLAPAAALAQPTDRLPNLTPSEFEIRGDVEIDLPQLERQPLSGFGPPPRTYVVPSDRQATTRPYGPGFDGLTPLALAPPPDPDFALADGRTLRLEGGFGTEVARYARVDLATGGRTGTAFVSGAYDGIGPTVAFGDEQPDPSPQVRAERFHARGGYRSHGAIRFGIEGAYARDAFTMPGTTIGITGPIPERTVSTFDATGSLAVDASTGVPAGLRLRFARTSVEDAFVDASLNPELHVEAEGHAEVLQRLVRLEGSIGTSTFFDGTESPDLLDYTGGLIIQTHRLNGPAFRVGARVLGYDTSVLNGSGASTTVFAPVLGIAWPLGPSARLYAHTEPGIVRRDLMTYFATNPFATTPLLAPDVNTVDAEGGLEIRAGYVGFKAFAGAVYSPTRLFFVRDMGSGLFAPDYAKARTFSVGGDLTVTTPAGIEFSLGGALRDGKLTEFDEALPYFAPAVGRAGLQIPFARGKGRIGLAAYVEGERPIDRADSRRLPGYGTLSVYGAYELSGGFGVVLRGERLAGRAEQWEGYPQVPYAVMGGVRLLR